MKTIGSTSLDTAGGQKISPLLVILGETASGKTNLGLQIARKYGGEIICADSRTIYKEADIGTAKPTKEEQRAVPHHLIDLIKPGQTFSAAQFKLMANRAIEDIYRRGKLPIMVGGTGLYIDSVIFDYQFGPKAKSSLRNELRRLSLKELAVLAKNIDGHEGIDLKNSRRLIRFIEMGGIKNDTRKLRRNTLLIGLSKPREILNLRISERIDKMFASGLEKEVRLLSAKYGWPALSDIGIVYRLFYEMHLGHLKNIKEVIEAFNKNDRQYAKRQRTWFKRNAHIRWFDDPKMAEKYIISHINNYNE